MRLKFDWDRSFSEPDLTDPYKHLQRFVIKHPHEYIAVDDLKFFRRKRPLDAASDYHTRSNICLNVGSNEYEFPLYTEYKCKFQDLDLANRPTLLRRSTSLHLEGLMHHQSEHQSQYHWFTPEDWKLSRTYPIKNPENIHLGEDSDMTAEYRSSYISYPMVDRTMKILPREMFRIDSPPKASSNAKNIHRTSDEIVALKKINEDKMKRQQATKEQQKSILQQRAAITKSTTQPSEYKHQFVQFPIEKAHSIPQISHIEMQGDFKGVPEYQDSFKMYANYSKSAPIKKDDNLRMSGAEVQAQPLHQTEVPEYKEKFNDPPVNYTKEKLLKTDDHLRPKGEFTKEIPEYHESFSDPQVKEMPERGKPREPYLRLKGKLEFNPEYRNTYLDFPRSRPVVRKPASSFRLPNSSTTTAYNSKSPHISPRRKYKSTSPRRIDPELSEDITTTPEYRRANYIYQIRERTPTRKITEMESVGKAGGANPPLAAGRSKTRKGSDSSIDLPLKPTQMHKRRPSRNRNSSFLENSDTLQSKQTLDKMGTNLVSKAPKFGRRATLLHNANKCRDHLAENNSDFALRRCKANAKTRNDYENQDSFVVLNEPCKRSNWMKKSWYDS